LRMAVESTPVPERDNVPSKEAERFLEKEKKAGFLPTLIHRTTVSWGNL